MEDKQASVPFFVHEATMNKMDINNKRMLIALITVCLTLILTVAAFLLAYTSMNNKWITYIEQTEVIDGIYEQSDQGVD